MYIKGKKQPTRKKTKKEKQKRKKKKKAPQISTLFVFV